MATVSEVIAAHLEAAGTRHIFGVPGGDSLALMEACRGRGIDFVLTNHETSAGFMADAYSLLSQTPGVYLTTLGPGATNGVSAAAQALLERSPVLVITAQIAREHQGAMTHQMVDTEALYRPVTKWSATLTPENADVVMRRALRTLYAGRPGPVHLSLAGDVADAEAASFDGVSPDPLEGTTPARRELDAAKDSLVQSRRPVILAGLGAYHSECVEPLRDFAARARIPVLYTPKVKGVIPEDSPWAVGSVGLGMAADAVMREMLAAADLVIAVGFDQVELVTGWRNALDPGCPLIWVDYAPCDDAIYHVDVSLVGDMGPTLAALSEGECTSAWTEEELLERKGAIRETLTGRGVPEARFGISPHRVTQIARAILPKTSVVTSDVGAQKLMNTQLWESYHPGTYLLTNGFSSMGYGLPAAVAAAIVGDSAEPVVCFAGDGGFAMTMHEMETAVRLDLPVIAVVFDDRSLSLIATKQRRRGFPENGVSLVGKDYEALARGFGAAGYHVESEEAFEAALKRALAEKRPAIIGCVVDPREYDVQL